MKKLPPITKIPKEYFKTISSFIPIKEPKLKKDKILPVCKPDLSGNEKKYLNLAFDSSWISSTGDFVKKFEEDFARIVSQTKYAVATNSGTTALHLALSALGIGKGDEVILPCFTMIATINAVTYCGAKPVLVDADKDTWNIDVTQIEKKITSKTKAIIAVHVYGLVADMPRLQKIAGKYGLWLVEDAAEAHGAECLGKRAGSWGDVGCFSFYANKIIATGEGGMVVTNNKDIYQRCRRLVNQGVTPGGHFWHELIGFGYRMTNLQASLGVAQTERISENVSKKRRNAQRYSEFLKYIKGLILPTEPKGYKNVYWMYGICVQKDEFGIDRDMLRKKLADEGIETRTFFIPLHFQPVYFEQFKGQRYPVTEMLSRDGLYLPSYVDLTLPEIKFISDTIKNSVKSKKSKNKPTG
jgi:perosamine synthetase